MSGQSRATLLATNTKEPLLLARWAAKGATILLADYKDAVSVFTSAGEISGSEQRRVSAFPRLWGRAAKEDLLPFN
jgi:hypothetical protein